MVEVAGALAVDAGAEGDFGGAGASASGAVDDDVAGDGA